MTKSAQKIVQYLGEAHATECGLVRVLQAQIAMTPTGSFRDLLEGHLTETRRHADRVRTRRDEISGPSGFNPLALGVSVAETVVSQLLAIGKTPFDLVRGSGGEEKLLKNAKDDCAAESLEIATYTALERVATAAGDAKTAKLASSILVEEERMLKRLLAEVPRLAEAVAAPAFRGDPTYDPSTTGAADTVRQAKRTVKRAVDDGAKETKRAARQTRRVPGVARVEGQVKGAVADESDLPITKYDDLTTTQINQKLPDLAQVDLAKIDAYERRHDNRTTVRDKITVLTGDAPWPGYDEQTVEEIQKVLAKTEDADLKAAVRRYEHAHKDRATVVRATERELAHAAG